MKSYRKELWFNIPTRRAFINITREVEECLRESGIRDGLILVKTLYIIVQRGIYLEYGYKFRKRT